jgi:CheY-like chemotaxis protein
MLPPLLERLAADPPADLDRMVELVLHAAVAGHRRRTVPAAHPYTLAGRQVDVAGLEVLECGLAAPRVLAAAGLPAGASGLAMGVGLDRLLMVRKGVDDIRLLRSADPRVAAQMLDLSPYRPVSAMPVARRDLSLAVAAEADVDTLGDQVRQALGADAAAVEELRVLAETPAGSLPPAARARLGIRAGQKNVLLRVVLRDLDHTLTAAEANRLRDRISAALHRPPRLSSRTTLNRPLIASDLSRGIPYNLGQDHDGGDPRDRRVGGLTGVAGGYQAPMTDNDDVEAAGSGGPRVLVVDDAPAIRSALRGLLEDAGILVVGEAPDGLQGVALTGSLRPDVVLMDLRMPASDGFQATARIVQRFPDVQVVVLSAYEAEESAEAVRAAGAFAFLPKHCDADEIRDTVLAAWRAGGSTGT